MLAAKCATLAKHMTGCTSSGAKYGSQISSCFLPDTLSWQEKTAIIYWIARRNG
jgi:hypothetical protein